MHHARRQEPPPDLAGVPACAVCWMTVTGRAFRIRAEWARRLLRRGANRPALLAEAKELPPQQLQQLLQHLDQFGQIAALTSGGHFPSLETLGQALPDGALRTDLNGELNWVIALALNGRAKLGRILGLKSEFETLLFCGSFVEARAKLQAVTEGYGYSLWAVESELLLVELEQGAAARQQLLAEILGRASASLTRVAITFVGMRLREEVSAAQFDRDVLAFLKTLSDAPPDPDFVFAVRSLLNFPSIQEWDAEGLAYAISLYEPLALVDRYLLSLQVLRVLLVHPQLYPNRAQLLGHVRRFVDIAPYEEALQLARFTRAGSPKVSPIQDRIVSIADLYTVGQYETTTRKCVALLDEAPDVLELAELYARAGSFCTAAVVAPANRLALEITRQLTTTILGLSGAALASQRLASLGYRYRATRLGARLVVAATEPGTTSAAARTMRFLVGTAPSAWSVSCFQDSRSAKAFLDDLRTSFPNSASTLLFASLGETLPSTTLHWLTSNVPAGRYKKYQALARERGGDVTEAIRLLRDVVVSEPQTTITWMDASLQLMRMLRATGDIQDAVVVAAALYVHKPESLSRTELSALASVAPAPLATTECHVSYAILLYVSQKATRGTLDPSELFPAIVGALRAFGVRRASQIDPTLVTFPKQLIFFLGTVCASEALDWSTDFVDSHDLENERIEICRVLQRLDGDNSSAHAEEIDRRTKAAAIRRVMQAATVSKVYVDTDGIRRSLGPELADGFHELSQVGSLERTFVTVFKELSKPNSTTLSAVDRLLAAENRLVRTIARGFTVFQDLFESIKHRFIASDEYGLDSYLSVRIRHGTLAGYLRGTFERRDLVTRKSGEDGNYNVNERWFVDEPADISARANMLLAGFSGRVDQTIEQVKDSWVQIRSDSHPVGFFDFAYSAADLRRIYMALPPLPDEESLLGVMLDELWSRTEACLTKLRAAITTELAEEFMVALDDLDAGIRGISGPASVSVLNAIATSRTEIQNELSMVAMWFDINDVSGLADYDLGVAVDAAVGMVRRSHNDRFDPEIDISGTYVLRGSSLHQVLDICFILLENIVRHSGQPNPVARFSIRLVDGRLRIIARNQIPVVVDEIALSEVGRQLEARASAPLPEGVKTEGGSGYGKLGKILRHDLQSVDSRVSVVVADGTFQVTVDIPFSRLGALH